MHRSGSRPVGDPSDAGGGHRARADRRPVPGLASRPRHGRRRGGGVLRRDGRRGARPTGRGRRRDSLGCAGAAEAPRDRLPNAYGRRTACQLLPLSTRAVPAVPLRKAGRGRARREARQAGRGDPVDRRRGDGRAVGGARAAPREWGAAGSGGPVAPRRSGPRDLARRTGGRTRELRRGPLPARRRGRVPGDERPEAAAAAGRDGGEAEDLLLGALEASRKRGTLLFELRCALSVHRLRSLSGPDGPGSRVAQARSLVGEIRARFTEGFATPDLVDADRLLATQSP